MRAPLVLIVCPRRIGKGLAASSRAAVTNPFPEQSAMAKECVCCHRLVTGPRHPCFFEE